MRWATPCGGSLQHCGALESPSSEAKVSDGRFDCARGARKRRKPHQTPDRETMETFPTIFPVTCTMLVTKAGEHMGYMTETPIAVLLKAAELGLRLCGGFRGAHDLDRR